MDTGQHREILVSLEKLFLIQPNIAIDNI